jgi:prepilin-type N-terminal cleavage/methylation domain-containing protein
MECDMASARKTSPKKVWVREMLAFTLIEMLVVIGIIGILATIIVAFILPKAQQSALNTANAELHQITTAIDTYHADFGAYPPDNPYLRSPAPVITGFMRGGSNVVDILPPLYYELEGAVANVDTGGTLTGTYGTNESFINQSDYVHYFGLGGPQNSSSASLKNYLTNLRPA